MTKKEIKKLAEQKISKGKSRQETFDEIRAETQEPPEAIAKIVRYIPSLKSKEKFKIANTILGIILIFTVIFKILAGIPVVLQLGGVKYLPLIFLFPIINIILTVGVFRFKGSYYRLVVFLTIIGLFNTLKSITDFHPTIFIDFGIAAILIGLGSYLGNKLVSGYEFKKVRYTTPEGTIRIKKVLKFPDEM